MPASPASSSTWSRILDDAELLNALSRPGEPATAGRRAAVALRSRGFLVLLVHRLCHARTPRREGRLWRSPLGLACDAALAAARYGVTLATKSQIARDCRFEGGVRLADGGHIIVGARSLGAGTVVGERVTIGMRATDRGLPEIGRGVWIGPGSVVYGAIRVGDGATILPGSVVSRNVPERAVVGGNPAVVLRRGFDNTPLLGGAAPGEVLGRP